MPIEDNRERDSQFRKWIKNAAARVFRPGRLTLFVMSEPVAVLANAATKVFISNITENRLPYFYGWRNKYFPRFRSGFRQDRVLVMIQLAEIVEKNLP